MALLPALTIYLGFNAGGYFADTTGWAATALAVVLAIRVAVSPVSPGRPLLLVAAALALFAIHRRVTARGAEVEWMASLLAAPVAA